MLYPSLSKSSWLSQFQAIAFHSSVYCRANMACQFSKNKWEGKAMCLTLFCYNIDKSYIFMLYLGAELQKTIQLI